MRLLRLVTARSSCRVHHCSAETHVRLLETLLSKHLLLSTLPVEQRLLSWAPPPSQNTHRCSSPHAAVELQSEQEIFTPQRPDCK